jgi:transmembrane sensor
VENFDDQLDKFLKNDRFITWVTQPDKELDAYWKHWMEINPGQASDVLHAKEFVLNLSTPSADARELAESIWLYIDNHTQYPDNLIHPVKKTRWYAIAASITGMLMVLSTAYYFLSNKKATRRDIQKTAAIQTQTNNDTLSRTNITTENKVVYLVDGSKIILQPGSSITHITFLQKNKREVALHGSAFFEVAKDAKRPFYVYANDIILRVLGTSFNVTAGKKKGDVNVLVHTGKVSVFKKNNIQQDSIILMPNQQMTYEAQTQTLVKSIVEGDLTLRKPLREKDEHLFTFEETPVSSIFSVMQQAYGIPIDYNEKKLASYKVTSYMNNESFEEKMEIICDAINAAYSIKNNKVIVESK